MRITWDALSERRFKAGTDRGVFYLRVDGEYPMGVVWNGLTGVDESLGGREVTSLYTGDIRVDLTKTRPERSGTINCITYPDEMDACIGYEEVFPGIEIYDQNEEFFGFCYRRLLGSADEGTAAGYEIHIIYNSTITGFNDNASTINASMDIDPMSFQFTSLPEEMTGHDPVTHIVISSRRFNKKRMAAIEDLLYGTKDRDPYLPLPDELMELISTEDFLDSADAVSTYSPDYIVYNSSADGDSQFEPEPGQLVATAVSEYDMRGNVYISSTSWTNDGSEDNLPEIDAESSSSDPLVGLSFANTVTVG